MGKEAKVKPLTDDQRSSFGLGWNASQRGDPFASNPHYPSDWRYIAWSEGWLRYRDSLIGTCEQGPAKIVAKRKKQG
jgi:hypothetical protein